MFEKTFAAFPAYRAHFWRDRDGAIKGEMLARVFELILDLIGDGRYASHMLRAEQATHDGYEVEPAVFVTFFDHVVQTMAETLGPEWTVETAAAWRRLLERIAADLGVSASAWA